MYGAGPHPVLMRQIAELADRSLAGLMCAGKAVATAAEWVGRVHRVSRAQIS